MIQALTIFLFFYSLLIESMSKRIRLNNFVMMIKKKHKSNFSQQNGFKGKRCMTDLGNVRNSVRLY